MVRAPADPSGADTGARSARDVAGDALRATTIEALVAATAALHADWAAGTLTTEPPTTLLGATAIARPHRPALVEPRALRPRGLGTDAGRIAAIHAVAHIEANAIRLALDAVHRFDDLPTGFHDDWIRVAAEEATHFTMLATRLVELGAAYGDLPAHDGLWQAAVRTADDPMRRMALVPRVLEARGLDVTPAMIDRFRAAGDATTAGILEVILRDEVGHVAVGTRWFEHLCTARHLDPVPTFLQLLDEAGAHVAPPLNDEARRAAGFGDDELAALVARHARR